MTIIEIRCNIHRNPFMNEFENEAMFFFFCFFFQNKIRIIWPIKIEMDLKSLMSLQFENDSEYKLTFHIRCILNVIAHLNVCERKIESVGMT